MNFNRLYLFLISLVLLFSCDSKPKVIVADVNDSAIQNNNATPSNAPNIDGGVHQVIANEILQTDRYTYLNVTEGTTKFWIATSKTEASKGKTYMYKGGLLKTNFESIEFKRTFDTIYLVASIIDASEHPGGTIAGNLPNQNQEPNSSSTTEVTFAKDAIKISQLIKDKAKYDGQMINVSGEVVKVNNGIMGRNWIHLQDGSLENGKPTDLTITTGANLAVGSKVSMKGKITLNKDFGAGYRYDIIMEDAINL